MWLLWCCFRGATAICFFLSGANARVRSWRNHPKKRFKQIRLIAEDMPKNVQMWLIFRTVVAVYIEGCAYVHSTLVSALHIYAEI